jgi:tetratricopeptide (TPR) repeat protein
MTSTFLEATLFIHKLIQESFFGKPGAWILHLKKAGQYSEINIACLLQMQKSGCRGSQNRFLNQFVYKFLLIIILAFSFTGCNSHSDKIEPKVDYFVHEKQIKKLPSAFPPLTVLEQKTDWGKEFIIGKAFAEQLDLFQAMTAFKRALILIPHELRDRRLEIQYYIVLTYYFGKRYDEVIYTFEHSDLQNITSNFPAFDDLMIIMYESYQATDDEVKAERILEMIKEYKPEKYNDILLSTALMSGDLQTIEKIACENPCADEDVITFVREYNEEKKSVKTAKTLNAFIPGTGYYYLGQKKSGTTSLLLNGLFIAATVYFFLDGNIPAGVITAGFEAGWYFGGIYGAGEEAKYYNERLYENKVAPLLNERKLYPAYMISYAF